MHPDEPRSAPDRPAMARGRILREKEPLNLETPPSLLDGAITPTDAFFVRSHFPIPTIRESDWTLTVDGEVDTPLTLTLADLMALPARTVPMLLECAGNGRANLVPKAKGLLWEAGAVGVARWTGVPLSVVLERAGVRPGAAEVILQGSDRGALAEEPKTPGAIGYERSLPLAKALRPEVLLAFQMNGKALPREHGFPVRAVVGGWYGMASVKWLAAITVSASPFVGYWQSIEYAYWRRDRGRPTLAAVAEGQVKAQIARPSPYEAVPAGQPYRVFGAAWAGEAEVVRVEISTDVGQTWSDATLPGDPTPFAWRPWEFDWDVPYSPTRCVLMARATDSAGRTQPATHDDDRRTYMIHFTAPVEVEVV